MPLPFKTQESYLMRKIDQASERQYIGWKLLKNCYLSV